MKSHIQGLFILLGVAIALLALANIAAREKQFGGQLAADGLVRSWREAAPGLVLPPMFGQAMEELLRRHREEGQ